MYIEFVAVYLLTCINYDKYNNELNKIDKIDKKYAPIYANYTDLKNNAIADFNYCGSKTCLIKCCEDGQYLDSDGDCKDEQFFKDKSIELGFGERYWDKVTTKISEHSKSVGEHFVFILRENRAIAPKRNFTPEKSYLLESGELYYSLDDPLRVIEVWRLHYCADYQINFQNEKKSVDFVFDISEVPDLPQTDISNDVHIENYVFGGGIVFTFISIAFLVCYLWKLLRRRFILFNLIAYFISLTLTYALKMLHVGLFDQDDCKLFSASLYFLLLSNFCWPLILKYNLLRAFRHYHINKKPWSKDDVVVFFRHCLFAWGLPLLVTLIALTVDRLDLGLVHPPFDNCFENEKETMLYLHVPVSIFIIVNTILQLIHLYELLLVKCILQNNPKYDKTKLIGPRSLGFRRLMAKLGLFIIVQNIPDIPLLLYFIIISCIIVSSAIYLFAFLFDNMLIETLCRRNSSSGKYQILEKDNSSIDPTNGDKIAIISNTELDKKQPLNYTFNIDLAKDKILASFFLQDYEKLIDNTDTDTDLEKNVNAATISHDLEKSESITDENSKNQDKTNN